ncbi:MAG: ketoglutarate semialdehyde dehydrogenase [Planctomycetaceae bacterium]|nr:MAG: ketoglutarate semialdehyde dehydrogenase [Planctomycetaceae bacterium]
MKSQPVLIGGEWRTSEGRETFSAYDPKRGVAWEERFPISPWSEVQRSLECAYAAWEEVRNWPGTRFGLFLDAYADRLEKHAEQIARQAERETALPYQPRLKDVELPRTVHQLRQAASAAREESWRLCTIDTATHIRSQLESIGPVVVFGPNNFPLAFNSVAGGDFAAAVAAGNPVLAKAHTSHPETTRLMAELAHEAAQATQMPSGFVQLIYRIHHEDGCRLAGHPLVGAVGYTGSRSAGLALKAAADRVGKPIYLELSSINPVVFLPGAVETSTDLLAEQFVSSCLMGTGQFCTNPGLVLVINNHGSQALLMRVRDRFRESPPGYLLSRGVLEHLDRSVQMLQDHGAEVLVGGKPVPGEGWRFENTLLSTSGERFTQAPDALQTEAFGNVSLWVLCRDAQELLRCLELLEGNLTGSIYSAADERDELLYQAVAKRLRPKVGRLLNDKMPTGVAVVPAMNHGGPFPATGHPGFTAVGIPASLRRFARLACYDQVRPQRLPFTLQDRNPTGATWRFIDGVWTTNDVISQA